MPKDKFRAQAIPKLTLPPEHPKNTDLFSAIHTTSQGIMPPRLANKTPQKPAYKDSKLGLSAELQEFKQKLTEILNDLDLNG